MTQHDSVLLSFASWSIETEDDTFRLCATAIGIKAVQNSRNEVGSGIDPEGGGTGTGRVSLRIQRILSNLVTPSTKLLGPD